jgi:hypothetical protein
VIGTTMDKNGALVVRSERPGSHQTVPAAMEQMVIRRTARRHPCCAWHARSNGSERRTAWIGRDERRQTGSKYGGGAREQVGPRSGFRPLPVGKPERSAAPPRRWVRQRQSLQQKQGRPPCRRWVLKRATALAAQSSSPSLSEACCAVRVVPSQVPRAAAVWPTRFAKNATATTALCDAPLSWVVGVVATMPDRIVKFGCAAVFTVPASHTLGCASTRSKRVATSLLLPAGLSLPRMSNQSPAWTSATLNVLTFCEA